MATDIQTILNMDVPMIVRIGTMRLNMGEVLALSPGAILELGKSADDELTILANNKPIGYGVAVKVGENFGIRVIAVGTQQELIEAMADK